MQEGQVSVFKTQRTRIACDTARCMVHQHLLVDRFRSVSSSQFESSAFSSPPGFAPTLGVFSFLCLFSSVLACSAGPYTSITMSGLVFAADPRDSVAWASCCDLPSMWLFFRQLYSMSRQHMCFVSRALRFRLINSRAGTDWWLKRKHESGLADT